MIDEEERIAWLRLARSRGIGPAHALRLFDRFGNALEAVAALPRLISTGRWPNCALCPRETAQHELDQIARARAALVVRGDDLYPERLKQIDDAPVALTIRGDPHLLGQESVAIVGARNASANGCTLAMKLGHDLAAAGMTVISGLARGIDTFAHEGALGQPGRTVAVVAGGADIVYPPENAELMDAIAGQGCIVAERMLGAEPRARDFPRRNRLISGLALGVLVVEAAPRSGSLITARLAAEQGREVMAVPGSPMDPRHRGTNQLLKEGATLVETAEDVLGLLRPLLALPVAPVLPAAPPLRPAAKPRQAAPRRAPAAAAPGSAPTAAPAPAARADRDLPVAARLMDLIGPEPVSVDELVRQCQASVARVQEALLELELEGGLNRHPGNLVSRRSI